MLSAPAERIVPAMIAPNRPNSGAYGDWLPSFSSCGPKRVPIHAPATKPASESTPDEEPAREADEPEDDREADDDVVDGRSSQQMMHGSRPRG